ncbi:membrane bound O-acyl transferase family-domain-containing protein [Phycomyces blakesleeanus]|uniref:Wax synthase domain-containing protein n=2 Tax=Phycomyces blakesleeanus TaxID=4837 RepID=A0A162UJG8_PHYB8|nr:hypothetical protein PHYBLDRAFT_165173 [Phycomyces blakesleeanus NRRL 1555(-)]OAD76652.1 hypothetical protein PHYBLDRAFT_165173 [Phycomyces blakesleeanus NRRL 1555(-)]|eukprot:XP_018294692.1 hypothetical protein PHYBLDRAFT_165173 [Phycomyces blakesleeanus NRRL 1555(-)]
MRKAIAMAPAHLFMVASLPVKRKRLSQEVFLGCCWLLGLAIPLYFAGQFSFMVNMILSVWAWATGMKMGVWLFSLSMDERRQRKSFASTLFSWRQRPPNQAEPPSTPEWRDIPLQPFLWRYLTCQIVFDSLAVFFQHVDSQRPVRVLAQLIHWWDRSYVPTESFASIMMSFGFCILFCVYLQLQLQVTYDAFVLCYCALYQVLPWIDQRMQSSAKKPMSLGAIKARAQRMMWMRDLKHYLESTLTMPPLFDSPWQTDSLRDFWSRRWHTIYNDCFYRLGYKPTRQLMISMGIRGVACRLVPALAVFALSGMMHEYFLYCSTGPRLYYSHWVGGLQCLFFACQTLGIAIGDRLIKKGWAGWVWAVFYMVMTSHLFVVPYILTGYMYMDKLSFAPLFEKAVLAGKTVWSMPLI